MKFIKKYFFLILFVFACLLFCIGDLIHNETISSIGLFSTIPLLIAQYIVNNRGNINIIYIIALVSSYVGVILYYLNDVRVNVFSLAGFSLFNLLIMIIVFEKMGVVNFKKIIPIALVLTLIFVLISYKIFGFYDIRFFAVGIYFNSLSLLIAFCSVFALEKKSKVSYYFLFGVICYITTSISTEILYLNKLTLLMTIINASSYALTHLFYYKAVTKK